MYYLKNSQRLSVGALKAWKVIRKCGHIGSGGVHVGLQEDKCGSPKSMLCLFTKRRYMPGDPVTPYNGRMVFFQSLGERKKPKNRKSHQRGIPDCGWGLDGLTFAEKQRPSADTSDECARHWGGLHVQRTLDELQPHPAKCDLQGDQDVC